MANTLRPLGRAWLPLLDSAVDTLALDGLDLGALWPDAALRRDALVRLAGLLDLVATWNARIDLTAARTERELVDLYLADALVMAAHEARQPTSTAAERWVDVGSGAGAPGLALHLLWPAPELTFVEPRQKRVAFLRNAIGRAAGTIPTSRPLHVVDGRSDVVPAASHDVAVSRATFAPDEWLREGARLARRRVWVLLARAEAPHLTGWEPTARIDYVWPLTRVPRQAVAFSRTGA